jgi:hypothetical protein
MNIGEYLKRTGTIVGLTSAVMGVAFFFFSQNQRIRILEDQMQNITVSAATGGDSSNASGSSSSTYVVNPTAQTCTELALRMAAMRGSVDSRDPIATAMDRLGCKNQK